MVNLETKLNGKVLTITIDTSKRFNASKSNKSVIVATTGGTQSIAVGDQVLKFGVNVFVENPTYTKP